MDSKNRNKITTFKTLLMLSLMMLIASLVLVNSQYVEATQGDLLLTINNPNPPPYNSFGLSVDSTNDGNLLVWSPLQ